MAEYQVVTKNAFGAKRQKGDANNHFFVSSQYEEALDSGGRDGHGNFVQR